MLGVAALLMLAAPAPAVQSFAGLYQIRQMEMAGGLELRADGRFRYAFDYGAVSETAEGDWTADAAGVTLTSNPMPKAPSFELVRDDPAPKGQLWLILDPPGFGANFSLDAIAIGAGAKPEGYRVRAGENGRVDLGGRPWPVQIVPMVPIYGPTGPGFALSAGRGHRLNLRFHANDLGRAAFDRQRLRRDGRNLVLERFDTVIRFLREQP